MLNIHVWLRTAAIVCPVALSASPPADLASLLRQLSPHFNEPAGSPRPGLTRGKATYAGEGFDVGKPERVMPTGAGKLSAMVAYGDRLELELSTTEYFNALADDRSGARTNHINPLLSPGKVTIDLGNAASPDLVKFDQHLDFARGSVVVELETREGVVMIETAGDMLRNNLVVRVRDRRRVRHEVLIRYANWRSSMSVRAEHGMLSGIESPDLAGATGAKAQSMSLAIALGCVDGDGFAARAEAQTGTITVPSTGPADFVLVVSARCAHGAPPVAAAAAAWAETAHLDGAIRDRERLKWWQDYWRQSWMELEGPGAEYLARLWYTTLYSYACVGQGPMLPKFNGGPGLVYKDARSWGEGYWWQNQREIGFWPMPAAGHPEFTRRSVLFFNQAFANSQRKAAHIQMHGLWLDEGTRPSEWSAPFGEDYPDQQNLLPPFDSTQITAEAGLEGRRRAGAGYNAENFSSGIEFTQAIFDYVQYTGDAEVARKVGATWLKGSVLLALNLLTLGPDGRYHVQCADATEQWWKVDDPAPLIAGIHWALQMAIRHGAELGLEQPLLAAAAERLGKLTALPTVDNWDYRTEKPNYFWFCPPENIRPGDALLAPCRLSPDVKAHNMENPELYAVFPFGLIDLNSTPAELDRAKRTFAHRVFKNTAGWSQCGVQAARLGLPDTIDVILEHARRQQKWPYGGWTSPGGELYPHAAVGDSPYFDGAGVELTALQEALVQSQAPVSAGELYEAGVIRLLPAISKAWSGRFLLHARGGFAVSVVFSHGQVVAATFEASRDASLRILNPFPSAAVSSQGQATAVTDRVIARRMHAGDTLTLTPG